MHSFRASFITPDYSNTKRMCSNDCFFVRTSWLEAKQGNRRRAEARGRVGSTQAWKELGWRTEKPLCPGGLCNCIQAVHLWEVKSFIHSSINISLAPTMYWKYFIVPGIFYVLSKRWSNKWNLGKQPFTSQLEMYSWRWKYVINLHLSINELSWWKYRGPDPFQFELWDTGDQ